MKLAPSAQRRLRGERTTVVASGQNGWWRASRVPWLLSGSRPCRAAASRNLRFHGGNLEIFGSESGFWEIEIERASPFVSYSPTQPGATARSCPPPRSPPLCSNHVRSTASTQRALVFTGSWFRAPAARYTSASSCDDMLASVTAQTPCPGFPRR